MYVYIYMYIYIYICMYIYVRVCVFKEFIISEWIQCFILCYVSYG